MHQVLLEVEGPRKSPKVLNEQIIQIPIFRMVHKTWKQYCTASSLLLYLHRNRNIPPANYFSSQNMYILKYAKPTKYYHFNLADSVETIRFCQKRLIQLPFNWGDDVPDKVSFFFSLCFTSAPFLFLRSSSSTFFPCLSVSE